MKKNNIILLSIFILIISSCKNFFLQEKASIKITLPFAKKSRETQQENIKYSFIVDCFEGSEITENPIYTQTSESGKDIIFEDVEPSVYSVRVRAFEYENFDCLLYEGVDTQPVIEGELTTFVILLKAIQTRTDGPTEIGKIMFEHSNQVWLEIKDETRDTFVAKTNCRNGVSVKNYFWFAGDLYLKDFSGPNKSELSNEDLKEYITQHEIVLNGQPSIIVEFSDGSYDVYAFSCYINQFVIEVANANFNVTKPDYSNKEYMNFLNQVCMTAFPIKNYTQKIKNEDDSLNYTFVIPENAENYNSSVLYLYDFSDLEGKNVKYEVPGEKIIYTDAEQNEKFAIQFKNEIPAGMYHANICVNVQIDDKQSRNYVLKELIYIEDGYTTSAVLEELIPFKKKTTRIADEAGTTVETGETGETGGTTGETGETGGTGDAGETVIVEPPQVKPKIVINFEQLFDAEWKDESGNDYPLYMEFEDKQAGDQIQLLAPKREGYNIVGWDILSESDNEIFTIETYGESIYIHFNKAITENDTYFVGPNWGQNQPYHPTYNVKQTNEIVEINPMEANGLVQCGWKFDYMFPEGKTSTNLGWNYSVTMILYDKNGNEISSELIPEGYCTAGTHKFIENGSTLDGVFINNYVIPNVYNYSKAKFKLTIYDENGYPNADDNYPDASEGDIITTEGYVNSFTGSTSVNYNKIWFSTN